ncbi:hypothetical protein BCV70DRAFT_197929 [Testicularia cyperi]|uniref:Apple domain-containing protein n=1 Tax=Testicularia cyperi TaxID=1882483 RepID=A0A317Y287_9BASI|nr:hypothetical protein BCV70DRAFT_197929 [Testicularia cyperi]
MVQIKTTAVVAAAGALGAASLAAAAPAPEPFFSLGSLSSNLHFNNNPWDWSCKAPWKPAAKPYFTFGCSAGTVPYWNGGDKAACKWPWFRFTKFCRQGNDPKPLPPNCNPPKDDSNQPICNKGYQQVFKDYTTTAATGVYQGKVVGAATIDNENYMTYGLSTSVEGCLTICDATSGCAFVNVYQDNVDNQDDISELPPSAQAKFQPGQLTCALYRACSGTDKATNYGGQQDPTYITQSSGYCKGGQCSTASRK